MGTINFLNYTPHTIKLNNGETFLSQGVVRVQVTYSKPLNGICEQKYGQLTGLPDPVDGVIYILSGLALAAAKAAGRNDCVAPASGHSEVIRNQNGHIVSVPCFVK